MQKYSLFAADPAWQFKVYDRDTGLGRAPDAHFQTSTIEEMSRIPVADMAEKDALMAMWVYDPMLPQALELGRAWGFQFVTVLQRWIKTTEHPGQLHLFPIELPSPPIGLGYHTRAGGCEEMWVFKRGKGLEVTRHDIPREFYALVREHSRKPDIAYERMELLYGDVSRLEMFARTRRPGWDAHGYETTKFVSAVAV